MRTKAVKKSRLEKSTLFAILKNDIVPTRLLQVRRLRLIIT